ncbi:MAG: copper transporter [Cyclobacteriaceae bacterium]|nr:MAG: copper transporter [Cyclobacteriaceae bacterium]
MAKKDQKIYRDFWLTNLALDNKVSVFVLMVLIIFLGISSYISLPKESYPEVEIPTVYVGTVYPGNSPVDMENLITRPLEKEINTIDEIDNIQSTSVQDYSTIIIEFITGTDVQEALQKVKDAVDKANPELPTDLDRDPDVFELNFSEFPMLNINLSGNYSTEELNDYAEYLEDEIEKFTEVSRVDIRGVDEKEVKIMVNPYEMESRQVNFEDIENAITAENVTISGGNVLTDGQRRAIRILGEFNDPQQLENIVIKNEDQNIIYLGDIATVKFGYKEKQSYARLGNNQVVMVDVIRRSGENLLILTDKVQQVLEKAKNEVFPSDLEVVITNDQSVQTKMMVNSLENNIISGVILVVLVLLFFLGTRNSMFVGLAIPLSMFITFNILSAFGITINMMVLFSLIMALGMLVDNGIVVVENVYRLMEEGMSATEATRKGVGEVAMPVIASTATTLAAFLPMVFWPGMVGEFMGILPVTLIITLGSSLFVALVINPVLISTYMKVGSIVVNRRKMWRRVLIMISIGVLMIVGGFMIGDSPITALIIFGNLLNVVALLTLLNVFALNPLSEKFQRTFLPWLELRYHKLLSYALHGKRPMLFLIGTFIVLILSIGLMGVFQPNVLFFPENQPKYVNVFVEFPVGADIETTNTFTKKIEAQVAEVIEPYNFMVESVVSNVGEGTADPNDPTAIGQAETPNKSRIMVNFVEFQYRDGKNTKEIMDEIRQAVQGYPGVTITVDKDAAGPPVGKAISIEITGEDYPTLIDLTENLKTFITESGIGGIEKLRTDLETGKPELIVDIDREKARRFGLSTYSVASELRTALFGKEISKFKQGEDDYEIQLRLDDRFRYDVEALMNKSITFRDQTDGKIYQVPIASVARAELSSTFGSVRRKELKRVVTISSNVLSGYNPTQVNDQIKALLTDYPMPTGYEIKFSGEQEKQAEEMAFLSKALMLAVFLIFLIIVSQFNKISAPFIIMTSVLFSTIGVFLGLVLFNMDFVIIMCMVGIISLAGIVVNNAIVLIDFIELSKKRLKRDKGITGRLEKEDAISAIVSAGKTRLRPVLLTAITTILGLIPLAVGINIDFLSFMSSYTSDFYIGGDNVVFWGPMSWTIIFGLTVSTFLTLVIVPVMYILTEGLNRRLGLGS